jgi:hypothetical protein
MRINLGNARYLVLLTTALAAVAMGRGWARSSGGDENLKWQPTHAVMRPADYAGSAACAHCHRAIFEKQKTTDMAQAAARAAESRVLIEHPTLSFERGPYTYSLRHEGGRVSYTVSDGRDKITEPVFLVVGAGAVFQTYLIEHDGVYYRAPVNYYSAQEKLGLGEDPATPLPASLEAALGKRLTADGVRDCFRCHSPANVVGDGFDTDRLVPGDTCEVCHGPGAEHVAAMRAGKPRESVIFNPTHLRPEEEVDFCSDCHHSIQEVKKGNLRGVRTVISQSYRLVGSRCWNAADRRSRCSFCHDPHAPLVQETAAYDAKCLGCHATSAGAPASADHPGKPCPVGQRDCARCHMPKVPVPDSSIVYTDHRIRIAPAGTPYPE